MPSTNKTQNLQLNLWSESDRPMRNDFNSDNMLIDAALGEHTGNSTIHLSQAEKSWVQSPFSTVMYLGNGEPQRTVELPSGTRLVIVFRDSAPPAVYDEVLSCTKYTRLSAASARGQASG